MLKGKSAYGCSRYKEGCNFLLPFSFMGKKIPEKQILRLFQKGSTVNLKGFNDNGQKVDGAAKFNKEHQLVFEPKQAAAAKTIAAEKQAAPVCPKCGVGKVVKGKTAYGCSAWKNGCSFRYSFDDLRKKAGKRTLTKELVLKILAG
jgi:DNA topoisomerase-3